MTYRTILLGALIGALFQPPSSAEPKPHTIIRRSCFAVDINYHSVIKWFGAKILNLEPDSLVLTETAIIIGDSEAAWSMELAEGPDAPWLRVNSDTSASSFTNLPRDGRKRFQPDAIAFVTRLRGYLVCQDSCPPSLLGALHMDATPTLVAFIPGEPLAIPDSEKAEVRGGKPRHLHVETQNETTVAPYISGELLIEHWNGNVIYPFASAHLHAENIDVKLYLRRFSIDYCP